MNRSISVLFVMFSVFIGRSVASKREATFLRRKGRPKTVNTDIFASWYKDDSSCATRRPRDSIKSVKMASSASYSEAPGAPPRHQKESAWPPWPLNHLGSHSEPVETIQEKSRLQGSIIPFIRNAVSITRRNTVRITSNIGRHCPPAFPALLVLSCVPNKGIRLIRNAFCRNLAGAAIGMSILSWAHTDLNRRQFLTPLSLSSQYQDIETAELPPFLPEDLVILPALETDQPDQLETEDADDSGERPIRVPRSLRQHMNQFVTYSEGVSNRFEDIKRARSERLQSRHNMQRLKIYNELISLQKFKKEKLPKKHLFGRQVKGQPREKGYALVTGASRGIGRAIAVELARWEIPLILVARDINKLNSLAVDLEKCYGVECCVLQADMSEHKAAEKIFETTQRAGLEVDVLVNNAGVSVNGNLVDQSVRDSTRMIQINAVSTATLAHLYGREMKKRRHGRILNVSSVCGSVDGIPTVAMYSATKAFQTSLSKALAIEMEPYGVGVTCLMPGAVKGTAFGDRSNSADALCWKVPLYAKTPQAVAQTGVKAMLRGEAEVTPGWQNRAFIRVLKPVIPTRLHSLLAETMWNPLQNPFRKATPSFESTEEDDLFDDSRVVTHKEQLFQSLPHSSENQPSRILHLEDEACNSTLSEGPLEDSPGSADGHIDADIPPMMYEPEA